MSDTEERIANTTIPCVGNTHFSLREVKSALENIWKVKFHRSDFVNHFRVLLVNTFV